MERTSPLVFITGATSFLGNALVKKIGTTYPLRLLIHKTPASFPNHLSVEIIQGSLENVRAWESALHEVDILIHLAAVTHGSNEAYKHVNIEGTRRLIVAAKKQGVRRCIFFSTRAIGKLCGAYGASKEEAERIIIQSGIPYCIVRPSEVYDDTFSSPEGIGMLARIISRFPIIPYSNDARSLLAPIYFDDVIAALAAMAANPALKNKIYTLTGSEELTFREVAERISVYRGLKRLFVPLPSWLLFPVSSFDQRSRLLCQKQMLSKNVAEDLAISPRLFLKQSFEILRQKRENKTASR